MRDRDGRARMCVCCARGCSITGSRNMPNPVQGCPKAAENEIAGERCATEKKEGKGGSRQKRGDDLAASPPEGCLRAMCVVDAGGGR